jgi:hypothetical protein
VDGEEVGLEIGRSFQDFEEATAVLKGEALVKGYELKLGERKRNKKGRSF